MDPLKSPPVTPRQLAVLQTAAEFQASRCYSATIAELADILGVGRPTVHEHLVALRENGLVRQTPGRARSLRLTKQGQDLLARIQPPEAKGTDVLGMSHPDSALPLAGRVCAGYGIEAVEDKQLFSLRELFGSSDGLFVLQVEGRSMIGAGIHDGDYVICHRQQTADNGQLVIALLEEDQATLKRFYKEPDNVCLMPENDAFEPIFSTQCRIEAVVVGLVRRI